MFLLETVAAWREKNFEWKPKQIFFFLQEATKSVIRINIINILKHDLLMEQCHEFLALFFSIKKLYLDPFLAGKKDCKIYFRFRKDVGIVVVYAETVLA